MGKRIARAHGYEVKVLILVDHPTIIDEKANSKEMTVLFDFLNVTRGCV